MNKINLTNFTVKVKEKDELTYAEMEEVQKAALGGVQIGGKGEVESMDPEKMLEAKRAVAEQVIEEIKNDDGEEVEFSQEWLDDLPAQDGMELMDAVEEETKDIGAKKKS